METEHRTINASQGDLVCHPGTWFDVLSFFLLNYGLHALTVLSPSGSGAYIRVRNILWSLIHPICGIAIALERIFDSPIFAKDSLSRAQHAGALCMMMPEGGVGQAPPPRNSEWIDPNYFYIHGQHPIHQKSFKDVLKNWFNFRPTPPITKLPSLTEEYGFILVPRSYEVKQHLKEPRQTSWKIDIACNYSAVNTLAAIAQIIYGSVELYRARGDQVPRFGYAAYSLTVLPYIIMSFLNLVASLCQPSYPYLYMVDLGGSGGSANTDTTNRLLHYTSCTVGEAEPRTEAVPHPGGGEQLEPNESIIKKIRRDPREAFGDAMGLLTIIAVIAVPYLVIFWLTSFKPGSSTIEQRGWVMTSLVIGHFSLVLMIVLEGLLHMNLKEDRQKGFRDGIWEGNWRGIPRIVPSERVPACVIYIYLFVMSIPAIGAFIFVGQMILDSNVCSKV